jgi:large subunit ribosomal protein L1
LARHGKKYRAAAGKVEQRPYQLDEAFGLLKQISFAKFNETVELSMLLGVDPKHADQMVRGTTLLPHGTGQTKRVLVIAQGEKQKEAQEAGADFIGGDELGKVLGPRGLMPNPKTGTVTFDVARAITEIKAGKVEFRVDKTSIIHVPVGKISFSADQLKDNASAIITAVRKAKPPAAKGRYVRSIYVSSTMSPSLQIDSAVGEIKAEG